MLSIADIANNALVKLGQGLIQSLDDPTDRARSAKTIYYTNRDALLRKFPWNFARKQMALNQLAVTPINLELLPNNHGPGDILYSIAFAAPTDILRLYRWAPEYTHWRLVSGVPFGFNGLAVITDAIPSPTQTTLNGTQPPNADGADDLPAGVTYIPPLSQVGCEYIAKIEDPNLWDSLFTKTLIASMAMDLAYTISGSEGMIDRLKQEAMEMMNEASAINGMENWTDQLYDNTVADVRFGYSGFWYNP